MGVADNETMTFINQTYQGADAFLFGRKTYELFAGYWGAEERARAAAEDPGKHPIAAALNTKPKYLASTTLTEPHWANTTLLSGDLAAAVGELKAKPGGELQVHGSGGLIRWLLENDLVDEITLLIVPVVLGQGTRLFPEDGPDIALDLVESRADSKGVMIQVYRPERAPDVCPRQRVAVALEEVGGPTSVAYWWTIRPKPGRARVASVNERTKPGSIQAPAISRWRTRVQAETAQQKHHPGTRIERSMTQSSRTFPRPEKALQGCHSSWCVQPAAAQVWPPSVLLAIR